MNIFLTIFITALLLAAVPIPKTCCKGAVEVQVGEPLEQQVGELGIIAAAAKRNNCRGDDFLILLAIRRAENGGHGREFGILDEKCQAKINKHPERSLDIQAGWAAATIVKNRRRWELERCPGKFIDYLGDRYCPKKADPQGNENWKVNVKFFYGRFKNGEKAI